MELTLFVLGRPYVAMFLDETPVYTRMMIGRWSSDALLKYIRKQVEQFSHNVAQKMTKNSCTDTFQKLSLGYRTWNRAKEIIPETPKQEAMLVAICYGVWLFLLSQSSSEDFNL